MFSYSEVQQHNTPDDAFVIHSGSVYDISGWYAHPGGAVIFTHAGSDMTDIFAAFHAPGSIHHIKRFYIGELDVSTVPAAKSDPLQLAFEKGYRDLRVALVKMGAFKSNPAFYAWKCLSNLMMLLASVMMVAWSSSSVIHVCSALLLGLFWQQCGWLAHDFLHHQVFQKRWKGDLSGVVIGNFFQGFSMAWWKNKHNSHHAVPNLHNTSATTQDGDPDIDTMPLLAWSLSQARSFRSLSLDKTDSVLTKFFVRHQTLFYFPILLLARLSWLNESFKTAFGLGASTENAKLELDTKGLQHPILEKLAILLHYLWVIMLSSGFGRFGLMKSMGYFMVATCSSGFFLAVVFGLGHNGMATYDADKRPDFWKLQVTTTRNIIGGHGIPQWFVDWFCGGLQYQVDHHLFPMMPRHSMKMCHSLVESFCKEWGVEYHEADIWNGTIEILNHLSNVSDEFLADFVVDFPAM